MDLIELCERGWIPDGLTRKGMRAIIAKRLIDEGADDGETRSRKFNEFLDELRASPIAIETQLANEQHYEVPPGFFRLHLGPRLKYSSCLYPAGNETLAEAEGLMLASYVDRADVDEGQRILDLGCGWGSLSLYLAERFRRSEIVGLSNSHGQRAYILQQAQDRGLDNLTIVTADIAKDELPEDLVGDGFDRVLSIEMFEHMKNYGRLLNKVAGWMKADARLFVHIFAHKLLAYHFEDRNQTDWMTRWFFRGGTMPSESLLLHFQDDLRLAKRWWIGGTHYQRTANHWLAGMDARRADILELFRATYGDDAALWFQRWRMFYMAVAELFGAAGGNEWGVGHYLFEKRG